MTTPTKAPPKKKAKAATKTLVAVVLDETGSMAGIASDTIGAVNDYFAGLAKDAPDALVSLMQFSDCFGAEPKFRVAFKATRAKDAPKVTEESYRPRGNTPLYDAIGKAITETDGQKADRYLLVVLTDGYENASTEWTRDGVAALIREKEAAGNWTVVYLGANQDAWAVGQTLGVSPGSTMTYASTGPGMRTASAGLASASAVYLSSNVAATPDFFVDAGQSAKDYQPPTTPPVPKPRARRSTPPTEPPMWP